MDVSKLRSTLNQTKLQSTNNALFQLLQQVIDSLGTVQPPSEVKSNFNIIEVNTSLAPQTVNLNLIGTAKTIIKDISGNAAANNITINATVDGVVNPVISSNYGVFRVYNTPFGYSQW